MQQKRLIVAAAAAVCLAAFTATGYADSLSPKAPKKVLVVSHTTGFRHSAIPLGEEVLMKLSKQSPQFIVQYCRTADDVKRMLTPEYLKNIDAVVFNNTTGNLGIPDLKAFLGWIRQGHAFIGVHAANDTYHPHEVGGDTSFIDMIGGEFKTHGRQATVDIIVEDRNHPSTRHLGPVWTVQDEIYEMKENMRKHVHVLLALDKHPDDGHPEANQPGDYLIAWCKPYGKGRVFYTALGHRDDVWESEAFQKHLLGSMLWAMGLAK